MNIILELDQNKILFIVNLRYLFRNTVVLCTLLIVEVVKNSPFENFIPRVVYRSNKRLSDL